MKFKEIFIVILLNVIIEKSRTYDLNPTANNRQQPYTDTVDAASFGFYENNNARPNFHAPTRNFDVEKLAQHPKEYSHPLAHANNEPKKIRNNNLYGRFNPAISHRLKHGAPDLKVTKDFIFTEKGVAYINPDYVAFTRKITTDNLTPLIHNITVIKEKHQEICKQLRHKAADESLFKVFNDRLDYEQAKSFCETRGLKLPEVRTTSEKFELLDLMFSKDLGMTHANVRFSEIENTLVFPDNTHAANHIISLCNKPKAWNASQMVKEVYGDALNDDNYYLRNPTGGLTLCHIQPFYSQVVCMTKTNPIQAIKLREQVNACDTKTEDIESTILPLERAVKNLNSNTTKSLHNFDGLITKRAIDQFHDFQTILSMNDESPYDKQKHFNEEKFNQELKRKFNFDKINNFGKPNIDQIVKSSAKAAYVQKKIEEQRIKHLDQQLNINIPKSTSFNRQLALETMNSFLAALSILYTEPIHPYWIDYYELSNNTYGMLRYFQYVEIFNNFYKQNQNRDPTKPKLEIWPISLKRYQALHDQRATKLPLVLNPHEHYPLKLDEYYKDCIDCHFNNYHDPKFPPHQNAPLPVYKSDLFKVIKRFAKPSMFTTKVDRRLQNNSRDLMEFSQVLPEKHFALEILQRSERFVASLIGFAADAIKAVTILGSIGSIINFLKEVAFPQGPSSVVKNLQIDTTTIAKEVDRLSSEVNLAIDRSFEINMLIHTSITLHSSFLRILMTLQDNIIMFEQTALSIQVGRCNNHIMDPVLKASITNYISRTYNKNLLQDMSHYMVFPVIDDEGNLGVQISIPIIDPTKQASLYEVTKYPTFTDTDKILPHCSTQFLAIYEESSEYNHLTPQQFTNCLNAKEFCFATAPRYSSYIPDCAATQFFHHVDVENNIQYLSASDNAPFFYDHRGLIMYSLNKTKPTHLVFHCSHIKSPGPDLSLKLTGKGNLTNLHHCDYQAHLMKFTPPSQLFLQRKPSAISSYFNLNSDLPIVQHNPAPITNDTSDLGPIMFDPSELSKNIINRNTDDIQFNSNLSAASLASSTANIFFLVCLLYLLYRLLKMIKNNQQLISTTLRDSFHNISPFHSNRRRRYDSDSDIDMEEFIQIESKNKRPILKRSASMQNENSSLKSNFINEPTSPNSSKMKKLATSMTDNFFYDPTEARSYNPSSKNGSINKDYQEYDTVFKTTSEKVPQKTEDKLRNTKPPVTNTKLTTKKETAEQHNDRVAIELGTNQVVFHCTKPDQGVRYINAPVVKVPQPLPRDIKPRKSDSRSQSRDTSPSDSMYSSTTNTPSIVSAKEHFKFTAEPGTSVFATKPQQHVKPNNR